MLSLLERQLQSQVCCNAKYFFEDLKTKSFVLSSAVKLKPFENYSHRNNIEMLGTSRFLGHRYLQVLIRQMGLSGRWTEADDTYGVKSI